MSVNICDGSRVRHRRTSQPKALRQLGETVIGHEAIHFFLDIIPLGVDLARLDSDDLAGWWLWSVLSLYTMRWPVRKVEYMGNPGTNPEQRGKEVLNVQRAFLVKTFVSLSGASLVSPALFGHHVFMKHTLPVHQTMPPEVPRQRSSSRKEAPGHACQEPRIFRQSPAQKRQVWFEMNSFSLCDAKIIFAYIFPWFARLQVNCLEWVVFCQLLGEKSQFSSL